MKRRRHRHEHDRLYYAEGYQRGTKQQSKTKRAHQEKGTNSDEAFHFSLDAPYSLRSRQQSYPYKMLYETPQVDTMPLPAYTFHSKHIIRPLPMLPCYVSLLFAISARNLALAVYK